jgi:hypothetical protein
MKTTRRELFGLLIGAAVCPRELMKKEPERELEFKWKTYKMGHSGGADTPIKFKCKFKGKYQYLVIDDNWTTRNA